MDAVDNDNDGGDAGDLTKQVIGMAWCVGGAAGGMKKLPLRTPPIYDRGQHQLVSTGLLKQSIGGTTDRLYWRQTAQMKRNEFIGIIVIIVVAVFHAAMKCSINYVYFIDGKL